MSSGSLPPALAAERRALVVDAEGSVLDASPDDAWAPAEDAASTAVLLQSLQALGAAAGLAGLRQFTVRSARATVVAAVGEAGTLRLELEAGRRVADLEPILQAWASGAASEPAATPPDAGQPAAAGQPPASTPPAPVLPAGPPPQPGADAAAAAADAAAPPDDAWALLRRALVRGHLNEAAALEPALSAAPAGDKIRPGSEPLDPAERQEVLHRLLEGVGSVLANDAVGGMRSLRELTRGDQRNLSIRWLAHHWSARAAMGGAGMETARILVKELLELSRQLDVEARAVSQLLAAELLARAGQGEKAASWVGEARSRFERIGDRWGQGRAWLVEARLHAAAGRDEAATAAARQASEADPGWDGPPLFLAGRALTGGALDEGEALLAEVRTTGAERLLKLFGAVRQGLLGQADAAEFLRLQSALPTTQGLRTLERIANAWPRFYQAREALGWMLLRMGKHLAAREVFNWLLGQPLGPGDRSTVMLGLGCIASASRDPADAGRDAGAVAPGDESRPPPRLTESVLLSGASALGMGGPDAVFSGRLSVFSLPDLIEFLRSARRTGVLECSAPAGLGSLRFSGGWLCGATAPGLPGIGELLLRAGQLGQDELARLVATDGVTADDALGELLVGRGLVEAAAVEEAIREQIELTLRELVRWTDGEFAFRREDGAEAERRAGRVRVNAQEALLNVFRELDEASRDHATEQAAQHP